MFNFELLNQNTQSMFDCIFRKGGVVIHPVGGFTRVCLEDINRIENVLCLCDNNIEDENMWGYPVRKVQEINEQYKNFKVLILSSIHYEEIKNEWLRFIPETDIFPCYNFDTRVHFNYFEDRYRKWIEDKKNLISFIYDRLADDISKKSFFLMLIGAEHYSASELMSVCSISPTEDPDYFHEYDFMRLSDSEDYLDVGAYDGDTVKSFLKASRSKYNSIVAVEPDKELYQQLERTCRQIDREKINCLCIGLGDTVSRANLQLNNNKYMNTVIVEDDGDFEIKTIDTLGNKFSLIKISVYNPECRCNIIRGGKEVLSIQRPKLIIQISRQSDDILNIPNEILKINPDYKIYFRIMVYEQKGILRFNTAYWAI